MSERKLNLGGLECEFGRTGWPEVASGETVYFAEGRQATGPFVVLNATTREVKGPTGACCQMAKTSQPLLLINQCGIDDEDEN